MTAEQGNLKPCPFCGGSVKLEEVKMRSGTWYGIKCRNNRNLGGDCAMEQVPSHTPEAAISRWNMRKPEDDLRAEIEALRKDAERYRWLRDDEYLHAWADLHVCDEHRRAEVTDKAIDAAMAKEGR